MLSLPFSNWLAFHSYFADWVFTLRFQEKARCLTERVLAQTLKVCMPLVRRPVAECCRCGNAEILRIHENTIPSRDMMQKLRWHLFVAQSHISMHQYLNGTYCIEEIRRMDISYSHISRFISQTLLCQTPSLPTLILEMICLVVFVGQRSLHWFTNSEKVDKSVDIYCTNCPNTLQMVLESYGQCTRCFGSRFFCTFYPETNRSIEALTLTRWWQALRSRTLGSRCQRRRWRCGSAAMRGIVARRGTTGSTGAGGGDHDWLGGAGFEVRTEFFSSLFFSFRCPGFWFQYGYAGWCLMEVVKVRHGPCEVWCTSVERWRIYQCNQVWNAIQNVMILVVLSPAKTISPCL